MIDRSAYICPYRKVYVMHRQISLGMGRHDNRGPPSSQPSCKYSHDWFLSQEQLVTLAKNAKKAPCNFYKNGKISSTYVV